jgi:hypothetical protein
MKTILFTNARDELRLTEWISHHLNIGFNCIYIYDHKSNIQINSFIKHKQVIVENIDEINGKSTLINKCCEYAKNNYYDWMLYLDLDEFLVLPNDNNVESFLLKYNKYDQIGVNWLMFGSNCHSSEPTGTMFECYTQCSFLLDQHIKSFVRPQHVINSLNPHVYDIKNYANSVGVDYLPLNTIDRHLHRCQICDVQEPNFLKINAFVAHYYTQSYENYYKRKIRYAPDDNKCTNRNIYSEDEIKILFNDIKFNYVYEKYNSQNKIKMLEFNK